MPSQQTRGNLWLTENIMFWHGVKNDELRTIRNHPFGYVQSIQSKP